MDGKARSDNGRRRAFDAIDGLLLLGAAAASIALGGRTFVYLRNLPYLSHQQAWSLLRFYASDLLPQALAPALIPWSVVPLPLRLRRSSGIRRRGVQPGLAASAATSLMVILIGGFVLMFWLRMDFAAGAYRRLFATPNSFRMMLGERLLQLAPAIVAAAGGAWLVKFCRRQRRVRPDWVEGLARVVSAAWVGLVIATFLAHIANLERYSLEMMPPPPPAADPSWIEGASVPAGVDPIPPPPDAGSGMVGP